MMKQLLVLICLTNCALAQGLVGPLVPPNPGAGDGIGSAVAMGGRKVLVGAPWMGPKFRGRAYLFDGLSGALLSTFAPGDWAPNDHLGRALAVDDEVAVISAESNDQGPNSGSVYVYDLQTGQLRFELHAPQGAAADVFGQAVALGPGYLAVSAPGDDGAANNAGVVYLFSTASGALLNELRPLFPQENMRLGHHLAVDGQWIAASSNWDGATSGQGAVFVFDLLLGRQRHRLMAWDAAEGDHFGASLAADQGRLLVGSPGRALDSGEGGAGKAYLFDLASGADLLDLPPPADAEGGDAFGSGLAIADGMLLVSAPGSARSAPNGGQVFVYDAEGNLIDAFGDPEEGDRFGQDLAAHGSRATVGAPFAEDYGANSGEAHLYCMFRFLGQRYCGPANLNSTLAPAVIDAFGARDVGCERFDLGAQGLPPGVACLALVSLTEDLVAPDPGHQGYLCLGGTIGAYTDLVIRSTPAGTVSLALDLHQLPAPLVGGVLAGETWRFQVWYRDENPAPTSNLTEGLRVTFE